MALAETKCWAMRPELLCAMTEHIMPPMEARSSNGQAKSASSGVSVVKLKGIITPQPSLLAMLFGGGGGGLDQFLSDLRSAVADTETKAVVVDVDSPGGLVDLVPEAAAQIRAIRDEGTKPIVAVANVQASSAAYWLASQANEFLITPSGEAGSIGVYTIHRDISEALAMEGIKPTIISAGKYKVEGNPFQPLDEVAVRAEQQNVDHYYDMFVADVAAGRKVSEKKVREGYGEGRSLHAQQAVDAGLADGVATLSETVSRLSTKSRVKRLPTAAEEEAAPVVAYTKEQRLSLLDALVASR